MAQAMLGAIIDAKDEMEENLRKQNALMEAKLSEYNDLFIQVGVPKKALKDIKDYKEIDLASITITGCDEAGFHAKSIEITFTENQASKVKIKPGGKLFVVDNKQLNHDKTVIKHAKEIQNQQHQLAATLMDIKVIRVAPEWYYLKKYTTRKNNNAWGQ